MILHLMSVLYEDAGISDGVMIGLGILAVVGAIAFLTREK
jgi:hypothetical protein